MKFDKRQTNIAKGIALMLLLWHHMFYNDPKRYASYGSIFYINIDGGMPIESFIADFCKVCVAIFLFLSGYGLVKSYQSYLKKSSLGYSSIKRNAIYVKNRIINLLSQYWVVYFIFVPLGLLFGRSFIEIYGSNPLHYITEILGVSYLFFGYDHMFNLTWWFMSIIIVYYALFPIFYKFLKRSPEIFLSFFALITFACPNFRELQCYILHFALGMYISYGNVFERLSDRMKKKYDLPAISFLLILLTAYIRFSYRYIGPIKTDFAFAFSIILFSYSFISKIPLVNKILESIGKRSGLIFMFHTFIYSYYFHDFIYSLKYSIVMYIVLLIICYIIALLLEYFIKITKYNDLIKKITSQRG